MEEECGNSTRPKQRRRVEMECLRDHISALPDALIHQILSPLPIEEAIRTGVLSKRWKGLWTSVPNLIFTYQGKNFQHFFQFVDKTLSLYSSDKVNKFSLRFKYRDAVSEISRAQLESSVTSWLQFASTHKVEELYVDLEPNDNDYSHLKMPICLYDNSSLTKLYSNYFDYGEPKGQVSWGLLEVLTISTASMAYNSMPETILQGCPIIEYLEFYRCCDFEGVDASSCTRLKLVLNRTTGRPDLYFSIPSVISMEISGEYVFCLGFGSLDAPSLVDVTLDYPMDSKELRDHFDVQLEDVVYEPLFEKLNYVEQLTLGSWFIQALSRLELKGLPSPLSNQRKCLTITMDFEKWCLYGVANLLSSSPNLEKLVIKVSSRRNYYELDGEELETLQNIEENFWEAEERTFECLLNCLKTVEIVGLKLSRRVDDFGIIYEFIKFILGSARVLERMVLVTEKCSNTEEAYEFFVVARFCLSLLPKSSPHAVVLFA